MTKGPKTPAPDGDGYDPTLSIRTSKAVRASLNAYAASESMNRSQAANQILEGWLRTHGWLAGDDHPKPAGPATDAVHAIDKAIEGNRARKGRGASSGKRVASVKETGEDVPQEEWERFEAANKKLRGAP